MLSYKKFFFFIFILATLLISACKKKDTLIGKGVLNPDDYLNGITTDTFEIETYTIAEDSIITSNPPNTVLGSYKDPKFGGFNASFYTQFRLGSLNPVFGDPSQIVMDSFVLALKYVGYYGDLSAQTFEIYELDEDLSIDSNYYSFSTKNVKSSNLVRIGMGTITPKPNQTSIVGGDSLDAQLRIQLDTNFAKNLVLEANNGTAFLTNEAFMAFFKGFYVKTNNPTQASGQGAAFYFNLNDAASKLTMYFKLAGINKTFDLLINSSCADFTHLEINNSGTSISAILQNPSLGQNEFYAQAFKHRAVVKIKHINSLPANTIIHKASLTLPIQFQTGYRFVPGVSISVAAKLKSTDQYYTSLGTYGGFEEYEKHFRIDVRDYIQAVLKGSIDNMGLVISPRYFINSAERIIFNGKNTSNKKKPQLIVTYSTF
ncbi:MAG: DUF4270 family protein [Flavobacteriia bacterium]|nr:DUF4270 family protein [Flavobacteriia bacterium]